MNSYQEFLLNKAQSGVMGVGSEVYSAVRLGRRAIGIELKSSYYKQSGKNLKALSHVDNEASNGDMFVNMEGV